MKRLLIPLVLLFLGLGGGVGAGLLLMPAPEHETANDLANPCGDVAAVPEAEGGHAEETHGEAAHGEEGESEEIVGADGHSAHDYVKLNNQFVVPLLTEGQVDSLVLMALSVEVSAGQQETVILMEPKLRDSFLQVLFDHANTGGFDGLFTASSAMRELRGSLLRAAQDAVGGMVTDVLILDLVRQDQ